MIAGEGERQLDRQALAGWTAWHTARLPRMKEFPKLADLMPNRKRGPGRKQTPEQMLKIVQTMNAVYGGADARKKA